MIVVCNTSPISGLATIGQLDLVRQLFGEITISEAVRDELTAKHGQHAGSIAVGLSWVGVRAVANRLLVDALRLELDPGESETIVLAKETSADLALLDERRGRMVARRFGLNVIGSVGVLLRAKETGLITEVSPFIDQLRLSGFWMSAALEKQVRKAAGEES